MNMKVSVFWFRRDLRLEDNVGLYHALQAGVPVVPIFIFDDNILNELPKDDARVNFIYENLAQLDIELKKLGASLTVYRGDPQKVWESIFEEYDVDSVYTNRDYEPYARKRDKSIYDLAKTKGIGFKTYKDQVIFEINDVTKDDGKPYTVYTPFKNKWLKKFKTINASPYVVPKDGYAQKNIDFPSKEALGIEASEIKVQDFILSDLSEYGNTRDYPALDATSYLGPHLRFGMVSPRQIIAQLKEADAVFLSELVWREFFMQILYHFPQVLTESFKVKYDKITWRNNEDEFQKWCEGNTGYPMVDAGMRQLNQTGYIHNRVRMVVASFLCKHLLIDWRWGEAYFAQKLLDYDLSANNGNWQWAAGTGCDAAPYFRVFNPTEQVKKFDKQFEYIKKWVPEYQEITYTPMVEHKMARLRALETYKKGLEQHEV